MKPLNNMAVISGQISCSIPDKVHIAPPVYSTSRGSYAVDSSHHQKTLPHNESALCNLNIQHARKNGCADRIWN